MRTVTFSHPQVANLLNQEFVNTFTNLEGDPTAGQSIQHAPGDAAGFCVRGNGKQNVQTIFMTPAGEILHAACGFLSPEEMHEEASFALKLFRELKNESNPKNRPAVVAQAHLDRLDALGLADQNAGLSGLLDSIRNGDGFLRPNQTPMNGSGNRNIARGSSNRNKFGKQTGPGNFHGNDAVADVLGRFTRDQFIRDNRFSVDYPLITFNQLEQDPTKLVGRENSFFSSSSNSTQR